MTNTGKHAVINETAHALALAAMGTARATGSRVGTHSEDRGRGTVSFSVTVTRVVEVDAIGITRGTCAWRVPNANAVLVVPVAGATSHALAE